MTDATDQEARLPEGMGLRLVLRLGLGIPTIAAVLFLPAGTWRFWPAWIWMGVVLTPVLLATWHFLRTDPELIVRRMKVREERPGQKKIMAFTSLLLLAALAVPGLDHRFGWSEVSLAVVSAANAVVLLSYLFVLWVLKTNSYASRTIEVVEGQSVVDTGPYAWVRHPMYTGIAVMMLASPVALGSLWAVLPFLLVPPVLVLRIRDEERALREELEGYPEYCERVRWRLAPGVW